MVIRKRIKQSIIPDILEQLDIWKTEGELEALPDKGAHLIAELKAYQEATGSRSYLKEYLALSPEEDRILQMAVSTRTYWEY